MSGLIDLNQVAQYGPERAVGVVQSLMQTDAFSSPQEFLHATDTVKKTDEAAKVIIGTGALGTGVGTACAIVGGTLLLVLGSTVLGESIALLVGGVVVGAACLGCMGWGILRYTSPNTTPWEEEENKLLPQQGIKLREQLHGLADKHIPYLIKKKQKDWEKKERSFQSANNQLQQTDTEYKKKIEKFETRLEELTKASKAIQYLKADLNKLTHQLKRLNDPEAFSLITRLGLKNMSELVRLYKRYITVLEVLDKKVDEVTLKKLKKQLQNQNSLPHILNNKNVRWWQLKVGELL